MSTILWHDYETTGISPSRDRPVQFAAQRTDESLNPVGDPITLFCRIPSDVLPTPEACLVTGLLPDRINREGLVEAEFAKRLRGLFEQPGTCGAGYNSIRFDDEVTRFTFWRNLIDPYAREWKQGNSRWDIIDMLRLVAFMKPDSLQWPLDEQGHVSFRLERLSAENGIEHASAHDALSDVQATIGMARLVRERQPKLYDYCWQLRDKRFAESRIGWADQRPFLHLSGNLPAERGRAGLFMPLRRLKTNKNALVAIELGTVPEDLLQLDETELARRLFTRQEELGDTPRLPIKQVHLNRSPVILPVNMLDDSLAVHWNIDRARCETDWQWLKDSDLARRDWEQVFRFETEQESDVDLDLYGGFIPDSDRRLADRVQQLLPDELRLESFPFTDPRMQEILFRYRARNWPDALDEEESARWSQWRRDKLLLGEPYGEKIDDLIERCQQLMREQPAQKQLLEGLQQYYQSLLAGLSGA